MSIIPEVLNSFRAYNSGRDLLGVVDATLPDIEMMTETIKGAGVAGETEVAVIGHTSALTLTLSFRTQTDAVYELIQPEAHQIELRGAIQALDSSTGKRKTIKIKSVIRATPKKFTQGKLDSGSMMDTNLEFDVTYIKNTYDGNEILEYDKLNYIYKINGVDHLAETKDALGL